MKSYSEINIGDREVIIHKITENDIQKFVELSGDNNRLHVDENFAKNTQFRKPVAHGMLGASFISTVIGTKLPGDGALWFSQTLNFLLPVRVGDNLTISADVIKKHDKERILEIKTEIKNQHRQIVTTGIAKVKVIEAEIKVLKNIKKSDSPKIALITGATGAIGKATCIQLAKDGFNIIIHYNSNATLANEIKLEVEKCNKKAVIFKADIFIENQIKDMIDYSLRVFDKIDVVVNCTAIPIPNIKFQDLEWADFSKQILLNVKSIFDITKHVAPIMISNNYGKIINIGSLVTDKPNLNWSHYITSKTALIGLTKSTALELAPKGIRINMVSPSLLESELTVDIPEKIKLLTKSQTPLRRLAVSNDVANTISFLASEKSDFLSGENIRMNGGQIMI